MSIACGDDSNGGGDAGGGAGSSGGGAGNGGSNAPPDDEPNDNCPIDQGPFTDEYAMKGDCCYRTSNTSRLASMSGPTATLEYRLTSFLPNNHPATISSPLIVQSTIDRFNKEEQHLLFRFTLPRNEDGEWIAGKGMAQIGAGRYNCDGTYSFYSATAAPSVNGLPRDRWEASIVEIEFDPTKESWEEQAHTIWATSTNRQVTYLPYMLQTEPYGVEWEAASQGFDITKMPPLEDSLNCVGSRPDMSKWMAGGETISYQRLDLNNDSEINVLSNISLAQLQAFGAYVSSASDANRNKDTPAYNPVTAERCMPGSANCLWKKLPDSLCPETEDEMNMWGCHVGDPNNADGVDTNCTPEKPTTVLDPDKGENVSDGQCCDPLAKNTNGLPACNAYRLVSDFAAAAVQITDAPANELQKKCNPAGGLAQ